MNTNLKEIKMMLDALEYCSDESRYKKLLQLIKDALAPHLKIENGVALWLATRLPNLGEDNEMCEDDFDEKWLDLIKRSADAGCIEAKYRLGCTLYENQKQQEALQLYKVAADGGYAPGQWCYGIDLLNGIGVDHDLKSGMYYIRLAAEQRYEYAVEFLIQAYTEGAYGLNRNLDEAKKWKFVLNWMKEDEV